MTIGEGQTILQQADVVANYVDMKPGQTLPPIRGMNPSGSFKDNDARQQRSLTPAWWAPRRAAAVQAPATPAASLAVFCSATALMKAVIFIGQRQGISYGKLAQALDHGALTWPADHRRFRRRHAAGSRSRPEVEHLPGQ